MLLSGLLQPMITFVPLRAKLLICGSGKCQPIKLPVSTEAVPSTGATPAPASQFTVLTLEKPAVSRWSTSR